MTSRFGALFGRPQAAGRPEDTVGVAGAGWWGPGMVWNAGPAVSAMRISAVWACYRLLSDAVATLPLGGWRMVGGDRVALDPLPVWLRFDAGLTRTQYLTQVMLSLLSDGNAFIATPRDRLGRVVGLVPLDPQRVQVEVVDGAVQFRVASAPGVYGAADIMHLTGLVMPGAVRGMSPIAAARDVVEAASAAQRAGSQHFANAAVPPAVIRVPAAAGAGPNQGEADRDRALRIAAAWNETHGGVSNAGKVGVLIGGAELQSVAVSNRDSQWLESRQFAVQEIARIFGVPPHLIADSSNSTSWGSGLAEQNLAFGQFALRPWIERIESGHNRLLAGEVPGGFVKLNLDALLRASLSDRYASYATGISAGMLTPNEARAWEELPVMPGGDSLRGTTVEVGSV